MNSKRDVVLFKKAKRWLVGGVNSPVRSFRSVGGPPLFMERAQGPFLYDVRGKRYLDFCLSWGAAILGHAPEKIVSAVEKQLRRGTSFGAATENEFELARRVQEAIPSMERIRFMNSGTEAVMTALRLARAFTKRDGVVKFDIGYHGHVDSLLTGSAGIPRESVRHTRVLPYNDFGAVRKDFASRGKKIAAVIVEPVAGNFGVILPDDGFLKGLRELCDRYGSLLILDEVITGFRFHYGGVQDRFGVRPDLTTLGKIVGGGFPVGAVGGRKAIMKLLAPEGPVYQAGTFSGNPITMTAGAATLDTLREAGFYRRIILRAESFYRPIREALSQSSIPVQLNRIGPMFSLFFTAEAVTNAVSAQKQNVPRFRRFFHALLCEGIYLSPSPYEANFISAAHEEKMLEQAGRTVARLLIQ